MGEFIRAEHLSHVFHAGEEGAYTALSDVSLSVAEGEFLAVLGTNGSGKSTLARHFNALLLPTEGRCIVAGIDTKEAEALWPLRRHVSMVFQKPDNQLIAAVDEPTAMLDPLGRQEVLETVQRLNKERGITVIYITHFMEEAAAADRIVVMESGRAAAEGTPREIFQDVAGMKARGLAVPLAVELAAFLRGKGLSLPEDILTDKDLVRALCP